MPEIGPPLRRAFAHNDYRHDRPLWDALEHGFTGIEADVFPVDGRLLVGHDPEELRPDRTLQSMYVDPIARLVAERGEVFAGVPLTLLVEVKHDATAAYRLLHALLEDHPGVFAQHRHDGTLSAPVEVVVSGQTDLPAMEQQSVRYATADGRVPHLELGLSPVMSMVSARWGKLFRWTGDGEMRERERRDLRELASRIRRTGRRSRFWGAGHGTWPELLAADVDWILTDDLPALRDFLVARDS